MPGQGVDEGQSESQGESQGEDQDEGQRVRVKVIVGVGVRVMVRERVKVRIRARARGEEGTCGALEERSEAGAAAGRERAEPRVVSEGVHGGEAGAVLEG